MILGRPGVSEGVGAVRLESASFTLGYAWVVGSIKPASLSPKDLRFCSPATNDTLKFNYIIIFYIEFINHYGLEYCTTIFKLTPRRQSHLQS